MSKIGKMASESVFQALSHQLGFLAHLEPVLAAGAHDWHRPLDLGCPVALETARNASVAATVSRISGSRLELRLSRALDLVEMGEGQPVRLCYWEEGVSYHWQALILSRSESDLGVCLQGVPVTIQQRRFLRYSLAVPFSFTVIESLHLPMAGERISNCRTQNISAGGLGFETAYPLRAGDKLAVKLLLGPEQHLYVPGWVAHSEVIERESRKIHFVGVKFLAAREEEQAELMDYLLEEAPAQQESLIMRGQGGDSA